MQTYQAIFTQLESRRSLLGISKVQLARRAGTSLPTVNRLLSGRDQRPQLDTLLALATALGVEVRLGGESYVHETTRIAAFREAQARTKAARLTQMVQGTMALEDEEVDAAVAKEIFEQSVRELLSGPPRRLWAD